MGRNVKDFYHLAQWVKYKGYDEINWNLGCPSKRVVKKGRGSGQLKFPDEIKQSLKDGTDAKAKTITTLNDVWDEFLDY